MLVKIISKSGFGVILIAAMLFCSSVESRAAQSKPMSAAELALYQGTDREKILLEGAKKEGQGFFLHFEHLGRRPGISRVREKISIRQGQCLAQRFESAVETLVGGSRRQQISRRRRRNESRVHHHSNAQQYSPRAYFAGAHSLRR